MQLTHLSWQLHTSSIRIARSCREANVMHFSTTLLHKEMH